jgi:hypothetical protein
VIAAPVTVPLPTPVRTYCTSAEVLKAINIKIMVFWYVTPHSLTDWYHIVADVSTLMMETRQPASTTLYTNSVFKQLTAQEDTTAFRRHHGFVSYIKLALSRGDSVGQTENTQTCKICYFYILFWERGDQLTYLKYCNNTR